MAARSVWKGFIRFSLVAVPVKAYTATNSGGGAVSLNKCNSRIQYKKVCPTHGELQAADIVSGYEFSPGQYVVIDPDEIDKLRTQGDKAINVASFIDADKLDSLYYSGRSYYLVPDGPVGQKPYSLLQQTLKDANKFAFAQVVFSGKEQIVVLRPVNNLIVMSMLSYGAEVKPPLEFEPEAPKVDLSQEELKLAKMLTEALAVDDFDINAYKDKYAENLTKLIEAKVSGKQIVAPPSEETPQVINLMEALKKSLDDARKAAKPGKPPKQVAPSSGEKAAAAAKRKKA
jgi:DNA end-binding protein Ku